MSIARAIRRRRARKNGTEWASRERPFRMHEDGAGYDVLYPTNGWQRFSAARLRAQSRLRYMAEVINMRMRRA